MTPRENFLLAMNHQEPEWVPVDMGKHIGSVHKTAYPRLREFLGNVPMSNDHLILDRMAQTVVPDETLLQRFHIDFRWVKPHWVQVKERTDTNGYIDMWGVPYKGTEDGEHFAVDGAPLAHASTIADLDDFAWPDAEDPEQFRGLREQARALHEGTGYVVGADAIKAGPLMTALQMRGYEQFFVDLVSEPEFADALLDRITALLKRMWERYLGEVGEYVQLAYVTDDLGTQTSLLISPKVFRQRLKPRMKDLHEHIKRCANVKLMMHSDGAIGPLLDDFLDMGVDVLNPVQTSVRGLEDTAALKAKYGDRLAYHGAIDVQQLMPNATVAEVRWEVAKRIHDLGRSGGYVIAPCHNLGPDIPPENIVALFDTIHEVGHYPLQLDAALATDKSYFGRPGRT